MSKAGIEWEVDVPLVTNPVVLRQIAFVFLLVPFIACGLLAPPMWSTGSLDGFPALAAMIFGISAALGVIGLLAAWLVLGNRIRMRFHVAINGVVTEITDTRARRIGWLTLVLGILSGKPGAAGSGMLTLSNARQSANWGAIRVARFHPSREVVELSNGWRTIIVLFCTAENYDSVARMVKEHMPEPRARNKSSPLPRALLWTAATIVATVPAFAIESPFAVELLPVMMLMCFALASVWLIPPLAWVVLACAAWIAANMAVSGLEMRESMFPGEPPYRAYEVASGDDWLMLILCLAGLAFMIWMSIRILRGSLVPVLMGDMIEMEGN